MWTGSQLAKYLSFVWSMGIPPKNQLEPLQVCWKCLASKGSDDLSFCYTNLANDASWRASEYISTPWTTTPEFAHLSGLDLRMISVDLLHVFHLGVGRDLIGSVLRILATEKFFRPGGNLENQLAAASNSLRQFAKSNKINLALKKLSKANLNWKSQDYPEAKCKGADTYCILKWLNHIMEQDHGAHIADELKTLVWCADSMMSVWANAGMFMLDQEVLHCQVVGQIFVRLYFDLAAKALQNRKWLFRVRPKTHLLHHLCLEKRQSNYNPFWNSTWMDEDMIKRVMKVKKMTHRLAASERSVQDGFCSCDQRWTNCRKLCEKKESSQKRLFFKNCLWATCFLNTCACFCSMYVHMI